MCKFCRHDSNDFQIINESTIEYSDIEFAMNRQGLFRARVHDEFDPDSVKSQDLLMFKYCPFCGEKFK